MTQQLSRNDYAADWNDWHAAKDAGLASPHGFLAVTAIHWLDAEPARHDDVPGAWSTGPGGVVVDLAEGESLTLDDGTTVTGHHAFGEIAERGGVQARFATTGSEAVVEVARRGGHDIVRPRHPDNPRRVTFAGTPTFALDPAYVVTATYTAYDAELPTTVGSVVDGLEHVYGAVGELAFSLGGAEHTLVAFPGAGGGLHVLFSDATAGVTTYGAVRSLSLPAPDPSGRIVLDFNRATNLPCAYTPHATCPLPPAGNTLPVPVEAGERTPVPFEGDAR